MNANDGGCHPLSWLVITLAWLLPFMGLAASGAEPKVARIGFVFQMNEFFTVDWSGFELPDDYRLVLITSSNADGLDPQETVFDEVVVLEGLPYEEVKQVCKGYSQLYQVPLNQCVFATHDEYAVELCARLTEEEGTFGNLPDSVAPFRDKVLAKERLKGSGVPMPRHVRFSQERWGAKGIDYLEEIACDLGFPMFAKPVDEARCKDVHKLHDLSELCHWAEHHCQGEFEIDEFVDGSLYTAICLIQGGQIVEFAAHRFLYPCFEFMNSGKVLGGVLLPMEHPDHLALHALATKTFERLPLSDGVAHVEFMKRPQEEEFVFIEAAARQPGGYISLVFNRSRQQLLGTLHFRLQLGLPIETAENQPYYAAWYWPVKPIGMVKRIQDPLINSAYEIVWRIQEGDCCPGSQFLGDSAYRMLLWNDTFESLQQDLERLSQEQASVELGACAG